MTWTQRTRAKEIVSQSENVFFTADLKPIAIYLGNPAHPSQDPTDFKGKRQLRMGCFAMIWSDDPSGQWLGHFALLSDERIVSFLLNKKQPWEPVFWKTFLSTSPPHQCRKGCQQVPSCSLKRSLSEAKRIGETRQISFFTSSTFTVPIKLSRTNPGALREKWSRLSIRLKKGKSCGSEARRKTCLCVELKARVSKGTVTTRSRSKSCVIKTKGSASPGFWGSVF